ncbi:ABC transporter permease [Fodinicurvata sp. CAU 1616]|uniref:Transport permease protein n=2 Tax=Aquibaculum arenosum TaxID=3032591 RepID=A0ABT5YKV7_9PROT|nr:ABC transporter permease [Fodinicurvata sp. CAU 1616]
MRLLQVTHGASGLVPLEMRRYVQAMIDSNPSAPPAATPPAPRQLGQINWLGLWTLYLKEVRRFLNVITQTVMAPVVTALLFLAIFTLALGRGSMVVHGLPYALFLAPGLITMTMLQNSFANTSSSVLISKVQGNIVDVLMPPLSTFEFTLAYAAAGVTRGLLVGLATGLAMLPFVPLGLNAPHAVLWYALNASLMLALLGLIGGIWAEKFDHIAAVTNFVVVPLSFLSGTFYSVERLPEEWSFVAHFNPFFYLIDGLRFGLVGVHDGNLIFGAILVGVVNLLLWALAYRLVASGYKLKP